MFGHEAIATAFKKLSIDGELSHAYLFFGDKEIGKFLFARSFGNFLENGKFEEPDRTLSDALFVVPAEDKKSLGIDEVREMRKFLSQTPYLSSRRLAIVDNSELLTNEAQSAMLKIVEEPPAHALIILVAQDPTILFSPLRSRLIQIYFRRFSTKNIEKILTERLGISAVKSKAISLDSYGRIGRAINLSRGNSSMLYNDSDLEGILELRILAMRKEGTIRNSKKMSALLQKETDIKRFNTNPQLQKKAIESLWHSTRF